MNLSIFTVFLFLVVICFSGGLGSGLWSEEEGFKHWYSRSHPSLFFFLDNSDHTRFYLKKVFGFEGLLFHRRGVRIPRFLVSSDSFVSYDTCKSPNPLSSCQATSICLISAVQNL